MERSSPSTARCPSPLHAARAGATAALCARARAGLRAVRAPADPRSPCSPGWSAPGLAAGVGAELRRTAWLSVPLALLIALVNPLVYQDGRHAAGPRRHLPRHGASTSRSRRSRRAGWRACAWSLSSWPSASSPPASTPTSCCACSGACPTARRSPRRSPPGSSRCSRATRCGWATRPAAGPQPPGRLAVARAALAGALDRAVDVAAALEVRGYSRGGRPGPGARRPWSRHDLRVAAAAVADRRRRGRRPGAGRRRGRALPGAGDPDRGRRGGADRADPVRRSALPVRRAARRGWGWPVPEA